MLFSWTLLVVILLNLGFTNLAKYQNRGNEFIKEHDPNFSEFFKWLKSDDSPFKYFLNRRSLTLFLVENKVFKEHLALVDGNTLISYHVVFDFYSQVSLRQLAWKESITAGFGVRSSFLRISTDNESIFINDALITSTAEENLWQKEKRKTNRELNFGTARKISNRLFGLLCKAFIKYKLRLNNVTVVTVKRNNNRTLRIVCTLY